MMKQKAKYLGKSYGKYNHYIYLHYEYRGYEYDVVDTQTGEAFDEFAKQHRIEQENIDRRIANKANENPGNKGTFDIDEIFNLLGW